MDLRQIIIDRLSELDMSAYQLAHSDDVMAVAHPTTVFRYLRGERDTTGEVIGAVLQTLRLRIARGK